MTEVVPFLRVRDAEASSRWYGRLGFEVEWRHRFADGLPLFVAIRSNSSRIFLSEHAGDARPGTLLYLYVDDVDALARELGGEIEETEYGMRELSVVDPDGNRLRIGAAVG